MVMRALLWEQNPDVTVLVRAVFERAEIGLGVVATAEALLGGATQLRPSDLLLIDCSWALADDLARCCAIIAVTITPTYIIHPYPEEVIDALGCVARGKLMATRPDDVGLRLLAKVRLHKTTQSLTTLSDDLVAHQAAAGTDSHSPLTKREQQVLTLVAAHLSNRHIAAQLDISLHTVKTHVANGMHKLGVETREELVTTYRDWLQN